MKKSIGAILFCFLFAITVPALALAGQSDAPGVQNSFSLENGITWDWTKADIIALEGEPDPDYMEETDAYQALYYAEKAVGETQTGDMAIVLGNDGLAMIAYSLYGASDADVAYFLDSLNAEYGAPAEPDMLRLIESMGVFGAEVSYEDYLEAAQDIVFENWELDDGTYIILLKENDVEMDALLLIAYINEARIQSISAGIGE